MLGHKIPEFLSTKLVQLGWCKLQRLQLETELNYQDNEWSGKRLPSTHRVSTGNGIILLRRGHDFSMAFSIVRNIRAVTRCIGEGSWEMEASFEDLPKQADEEHVEQLGNEETKNLGLFRWLIHVYDQLKNKIANEQFDRSARSNECEPIDAMDLRSLTFRSLDLKDSTPPQSDFLNLDDDIDDDRDSSRQSNEELTSSSKQKSKELKTIDLDEVAWHDTADNCWICIRDFVYDCTDFLKNHPGGSDVILEYAGRDATLAFIGTGHTRAATRILDRFLIGELPLEERIFRVPDGVKVPGF